MTCAICAGNETIESTVRFQLIAEVHHGEPRPFIPLCKAHLAEAEGAYREIKRIQTGPVTVNLPGLRVGGAPGSSR
jgi:hypothetical protein